MKYTDILASYLPTLIVDELVDEDYINKIQPARYNFETVCLFADISGFTMLMEKMFQKFGAYGSEYVAKHLNSYMGQMVRLIGKEGGDIFKYAGDAMIVIWPNSGELVKRARNAAQCALAMQDRLHELKMEEGVVLSVKIGIGVGEISILHLGGVLNRMEYVAVGSPLVQAFASEHHGVSGDSIVSSAVWDMIKPYFGADTLLEDGFVKLKDCTCPVAKNQKKQVATDAIQWAEEALRNYCPGAVLPLLSPHSSDYVEQLEKWAGSELRDRCSPCWVLQFPPSVFCFVYP
jgi:adenylate cyclase 10